MSTSEPADMSLVRQIRKALGLTQAQMAEQIGCKVLSIKRFERDNKLPRVDAVMRNLRLLATEAGIALPEQE
jgi:transcriptional regulator with XRE-family HTH domain